MEYEEAVRIVQVILIFCSGAFWHPRIMDMTLKLHFHNEFDQSELNEYLKQKQYLTSDSWFTRNYCRYYVFYIECFKSAGLGGLGLIPKLLVPLSWLVLLACLYFIFTA